MAEKTYGERLADAIKLAGADRARVAKAVGKSVQAVGQVIRGDSGMFAADNHVRAARELEVDPHWLATGEGVPRPAQPWPFASFLPSQYARLPKELRDEVEDRLLGAITRMEREAKRAA